jgi:hypothetical protein
MAVYRWAASSGSFGFGSNWSNTTLKINPARTPPGVNDSAEFFTSGGTITGSGSVGGMAFQGTLGAPLSIAAQLRSASSLVAGATELVAGGTWDAGTLSVVSGGRLSVLDGGALQAGSIGLTSSAVLAVSGTGSAVVGGGAALAGALTVAGSLTGAGTVSATGGIVDGGVIAASGGTLRLAGPVSGGGSLLVGDGATLSLGGLSAVGVAFTGPGATLEVLSLSVGGTSVLSEKGVITGFTPGETIRDADDAPVTGAVYAAAGAGLGTLTLLNGSTPLGILTLAGAFDGYDFSVAQHGTGGTDITLTARAQTPAPSLAPVSNPLPPVLDLAPPVPESVPAPVPVSDPVPPMLDAAPPASDPVPVPVSDPVPPVLDAAPPASDPAPVPVSDPVPPVLDAAPPASDPASVPTPVPAPVSPILDVASPVPAGVPVPAVDPRCNARDHLHRNFDVEGLGVKPLLHCITVGQGEGRMAFLTAGQPPVDLSAKAPCLALRFSGMMRLAGIDAADHVAFMFDHGIRQLGPDPSASFGTSFYLIHNPDSSVVGVSVLVHQGV